MAHLAPKTYTKHIHTQRATQIHNHTSTYGFHLNLELLLPHATYTHAAEQYNVAALRDHRVRVLIVISVPSSNILYVD